MPRRPKLKEKDSYPRLDSGSNLNAALRFDASRAANEKIIEHRGGTARSQKLLPSRDVDQSTLGTGHVGKIINYSNHNSPMDDQSRFDFSFGASILNMRTRHEQIVPVCDTEQQVCHDFINLIGSQNSSIMIANMRQERRGAPKSEEFPSWFASLS